MTGAAHLVAALLAGAEERWPGVDEAVVERLAAQAGRRPWAPLVDAQGDLRLFLFLAAGIAGGFAAGYLFRLLFVEQAARSRPEGQ